MRLFPLDWQVAYREKNTDILHDTSSPFTVIPNNNEYSAADPFVFNYEGREYIFAELIDKHNGKGCIGFTKMENGIFASWQKIISEPFHMSYPNIFKYRNEIFILPETHNARCLYLYKAIEFPYKWEKMPAVLSDINVVDSTLLFGDKIYLFTYELTPDEDYIGNLWIYRMSDDFNFEKLYEKPVSNNDMIARPGGNFFIDCQGRLVRVSQNCKDRYGEELVFSEVFSVEDQFVEKTIQHVGYKDLMINTKSKLISGLHTYNADNKIEVIDFRITDFSLNHQWKRLVHKIGIR